MRFAVVLVLLAACGRASSGPAWPKAYEPEKDGGESLAPRQASAVAAIEDADSGETKPAAAPVTPAKPGDPVTPAATPATPGTTPAADDVIITTEDIVIEIDE